MLREVIRFEWRYHTRQLVFPVAAFGFAFMGYIQIARGGIQADVHANSPWSVVSAMGLLSLLSVFLITIFCAGSATRDAEHGMREIVYATSVGKLRYLAGRFLGSLAAATAACAFLIPGMLLAPLMAGIPPERLAPTTPVPHLWGFLLIILPNLIIAGAVIFAVAALTRSTLASYVAGVFVVMVYMVVSLIIDSPLMAGSRPQTPEALALAALLDPFGISALFQAAWFWTPAERNTLLVPLQGYLLANRLLMLALSGAVLATTYRFFSFRPAGRRPAGAEAAEEAPAGRPYRPSPVHPQGRRARWAALRSLTALEFRATVGSKPFLALLVLWVMVIGIEVSENLGQEYGTRTYPTTAVMMDAIELPLLIVGVLMLVFFAADVMWRERTLKAHEMAHASPTPSAAFYLAKLGALVLMTGVFTASAVTVAVVFQLANGYTRLEPAGYLGLLFFVGLPLALLAVPVVLLQAIAPNRYVGMLLGVVFAVLVLGAQSFGWTHAMVRFAAGPRSPYSEMSGYAAPGVFAWYMLYWGALAGVLGWLTCALWTRGTPSRLLARVRRVPLRLGRPGLIGVGACAALFLGTGGFVFYNTNVLGRYQGEEEILRWRTEYERRYGRWEGRPTPSVVGVQTEVALHPRERRFTVSGRYTLLNRTDRPVDTVMVFVQRDLRLEGIILPGARAVARDEAFGTTLFALDEPLQPGEWAELRFRLRSGSPPIPGSSLDYSVVANGSYLSRDGTYPDLGYQRRLEINTPEERARRGLPPQPPRPGPETALEDWPAMDAWMTVDATVSTDADQVVLGPGDLVARWESDGRRYFRFRQERPTTPVFAFASGRYRVKRVVQDGVSVEVYFHPEHADNVDHMLAVAQRSLARFGRAFGEYPERHLRIVEIPAFWPWGAYALPGMIVYPEHRGFMVDRRAGQGVDLVARRVAHEIAHQWWGHQLSPARVEGGTMLVETLAKYSEQLIVRDLMGEAAVAELMGHERDSYLLGRTTIADEPPLMRVTNQSHVAYAKGALVMNALADLLGEDAVNRALARLLREHGYGKTPATTLHLLRALQSEAAPEHRPQVAEWLGRVTLYDLQVTAARAEREPDGRYRVTATIRAAKRVEWENRLSEAPVDELLELAVHATHPDDGAEPIHAAKQRIRSGDNEISFIVSSPPRFVSVDRLGRRIEVNRTDNVLEISPR